MSGNSSHSHIVEHITHARTLVLVVTLTALEGSSSESSEAVAGAALTALRSPDSFDDGLLSVGVPGPPDLVDTGAKDGIGAGAATGPRGFKLGSAGFVSDVRDLLLPGRDDTGFRDDVESTVDIVGAGMALGSVPDAPLCNSSLTSLLICCFFSVFSAFFAFFFFFASSYRFL